MLIRGVITPLYSGVGIGVALAPNKMDLESLELDPQLEPTPSLELAPQESQFSFKDCLALSKVTIIRCLHLCRKFGLIKELFRAYI